METDQMKSTWQLLGQQLERSNTLQLHALRERHLDKTRASLRPLFWGQVLQILLAGVPFMLLAGLLWHHAGLPGATLPLSTLLAGITVHIYGLAATVLAGSTLGRIHGIDYATPVLEIQEQLGRLRRLYIVNGMIVGLPWWFLWVPLLMTLSGLANVDLYARAPSLVWIGMGIGISGLLGTWWFHHWSRSPKRPRLAKAMQDSVIGGSLRRAQTLLDELERFARE
ncbi:MAG: serine/threonine protein kinase [Pseudoxanthomonas sp.]|jgi:hypothetical protein